MKNTSLFLCAAGVICCLTGNAMAISISGVTFNTDPANAPQYSKVELAVNLANVAATQFYETDPTQNGLNLSALFTGPDGSSWNSNGYYDGTNWLIRFTPVLLGAWTFTVSVQDSSGTASQPGGSFTCVPSASPGFAQLNGAWLQFSNNTAYYAIGHNNGWQYDVEQPALSDMASQGENLLSFWMATPWVLPTDGPPNANRAAIENVTNGVGNYDQVSCAYIDGVVARAESANVYLLPSLWAHDQLCDGSVPSGWPASWSNNGYSAHCSATNFYQTASNGVDTAQWHYQKNLYRYILARWGYSRAIAGWVGVVEIDGTTGYANNSAQASTWCVALRNYFASNDPYRLNAAGYPLAVSKVDQPSWNSGLDMRGTDSYSSQTDNTGVALTLANEAGTMRASGKPAIFPEFGGNTTSGATQPTHLHNGIWAGSSAGAAMTPLLWCDGGSFPMLNNSSTGPAMRAQLQYLSQFTTGLDVTGNAALAPSSLTLSGTTCRGWGLQLGNRGFAWLQNTSGTAIGGQTLTIHNLTPGQYSVAWYNVWASGSSTFNTTPSVTVSSTGNLIVEVPTLSHADIACRFFANSGPPTVIAGASATPNPVTGATTFLSVGASDDGGAGNLTYTWSAIGTPPAPVIFTPNGVNAAQNATAMFSKAGTYTLQVFIADLGGFKSTSSVTVTVNQSFTAFAVTPPSATVNLTGSQQFTVSANDQFGNPIAPSPTATWSVGGGGTIDGTGLFKAGGIAGGPFTVTAVTATFTGTASVGVIDAPPTISLISPATNSTIATGTSIALSASAGDVDGSITKVDFYANSSLIGTINGAPFTFNWTPSVNGSYQVSAIATDNGGLTTTSAAITVNVDNAPTVSISSPANNATFSKTQTTVTIKAIAKDSDGSVNKVVFYDGGTALGTGTFSAPSTYSLTHKFAAGTHLLTSKATDNTGLTTTSQVVTITVR